MATRIRIGKQTELSQNAGAIIVTDVNKEQGYLDAGAEGQVLSIVGGVPAYATPVTASFSFSDGVNTQTVSQGDTFTITQGNGITATVSATNLLTIAAKLSADGNNAITIGTDGGIYVPQASLLTGVTWDDATNNMVFNFASGDIVYVPVQDLVGTFLADFTVSDGTTTTVIPNHDTLTVVGNGIIKTTVSLNQVQVGFDTSTAVVGAVPVVQPDASVAWVEGAFSLGSGTKFTNIPVGGQVVLQDGVGIILGATGNTIQANLAVGTEVFKNLTSGNTITPATLFTSTLGLYRNGILQVSFNEDPIDYDYLDGATVTFVVPFGTSGGATGGETIKIIGTIV